VIRTIVTWVVIAWLILFAISHQAEISGWVSAFVHSAQSPPQH
jgi:hypothetical protein